MDVQFTLQLMASLPAKVASPWMEFGCVDDGIPTGIFTPSLVLKDGALQLPNPDVAPYGWGVSVKLDGDVTRSSSSSD
jgi:hypothetical protein